MRKAHFLLIGMLLFTYLCANLTVPIVADEPHGTRSPGADVTLTSLSGNQTGNPTETLSYLFNVNNTGNETDNFTVSAQSENYWLMNWTDHIVGPLASNESIEVEVNITIPMGTPAYTVDDLTFSAESHNEAGFKKEIIVNTTVNESFILGIDIEGGYSKTSSIDPPNVSNFTLTLSNKGNDDVTVTLNVSASSSEWEISCQYSDWNVTIYKANLTAEGMENVNLTITAPSDAQPGQTLIITLWAEKKDEDYYSWREQENITLTTVVQSVLGVRFIPEKIVGNVSSGETLYPFTMENSGNTDVNVDMEVEKDQILITTLDRTFVRLRVDGLPIDNTLRVGASQNAAQGNYTINVTARDRNTGLEIGSMELYYIIVPVLNITNISISDSEPMQYKSTNVFVTIENIGYVNARNITIKLYDGSKKVAEAHLDVLNASDTEKVKVEWSPSDYGDRNIRVVIDVEAEGGEGDFSPHGTNIAEKYFAVDVKINWQPYYLTIYIFIVIILGIGTISAMISLRYHGVSPHLNDYEEGAEEMPYEGYPEEAPFHEGEEEPERPFAPIGLSEELERPREEPFPYEKPEYPPPPPERRKEPFEREIPPPLVLPKDRETLQKEDDLKDELWKLQDRLDNAKSLGIDTTNIDQLLKTAKKSLNEGDYRKTKQYIGYANERLKNIMTKRDEALQAIKEAKELLSGMRGTADLTIVENFLVKADSLFNEGDFREAKNYANKAKERAVRLQRHEMRL